MERTRDASSLGSMERRRDSAAASGSCPKRHRVQQNCSGVSEARVQANSDTMQGENKSAEDEVKADGRQAQEERRCERIGRRVR